MSSEDKILNAKILIIDDQKLDVLVIEKILRTAGYSNIRITFDSRQANLIYREFQPDIVLLDLNMPHLDGFGVMEQLKEIERDSYLPVLVISSERSQEVRLRALHSGAKDFLNKPYESVEVLMRIHNMIEVRMLHNEIRNQNKMLETKVNERTVELRETRLDIIHRLARAAEFRDNETGIHVIRMSRFSTRLAQAIGMSEAQCDLMLHASPLHDIGKIGIPDSILLKAGKLDPEEWETMKTHTTIGAKLLSDSSFALMKMAKLIALTHHEKWDGTGYPRALKGEDIPLVGRICALCDVFDALTSKRPYKEAWPTSEAMVEIQKGKGTHFDPTLVDTFLKILPDIERIKEENSE